MLDDDGSVDSLKALWRKRAVRGRRARTPEQIERARAAITGWLLPELAGHTVVAAFLPLPTEPLSDELPHLLRDNGCRVLLPVTSPQSPLDWAEWNGRSHAGQFGIREPDGQALGPTAIRSVDAVVVPAMLVDRRGVRLGRGGGHYDRTLGAVTCPRIAVVFDDEVVDELPATALDQPVSAVVTPSGIIRF